MTDTTQRPELPDHLSTEERSPHFNKAIFEYDVGIRFNDKDRNDVQDYCISEGWIKVPVAKRSTAKVTR